jgi:hypothetical protein
MRAGIEIQHYNEATIVSIGAYFESDHFCSLRCGLHTKAKYQPDRPSIPPPFVNTAIVRAHPRKIRKPWNPWMRFFVRPGLNEGRLIVVGNSVDLEKLTGA